MNIERQYKFNRRGAKYKAKYFDAMTKLFKKTEIKVPTLNDNKDTATMVLTEVKD
jgi:hypothetical protein